MFDSPLAVAAGAAVVAFFPLLWMRHALFSSTTRLPLGFSSTVRFRLNTNNASVATQLAQAIRALEDPQIAQCKIVKDTYASQLAVTFRTSRATEEVRFTIDVAPSTELRHGVEAQIQGPGRSLFAMPRGPSQRVIEIIARALVKDATNVRWSERGRHWQEKPFFGGVSLWRALIR